MYSTDELIDRIRELEAAQGSARQGEFNDTAGDLATIRYMVEPRYDGKGVFFDFSNGSFNVTGGMTEEEAIQLIADIKDALADRD